ncbi:MAG: DUF4145 domain-containing protein [Isosphaeraceae bacterium]
MDSAQAQMHTDQLVAMAMGIVATAKTAYRNKKSLCGDNHYGHKFHDNVVKLSSHRAHLLPVLRGLGLESSEMSDLECQLRSLTLPVSTVAQRSHAAKSIKLIAESVIKPKLRALSASPVPSTEQVLPLSLVKETRTYFERIVTQANGCYEHQWFDACSVMIRRFVETLVIELYEGTHKEAEIKDPNGDFLALSKLVDKTLAERSWNLSRDSKRALPLVKSLGDRSAHNRRYVATKRDVDEVIPGLRVLAEELLHLAALK